MISCSCTEPDVVVKKSLTVTPDSLEFVIDGGVDTIYLTTNSREWHISTTTEWISTNLDFGITKEREIVVTVQKNAVKESRTGYIIVAAPDADTVRIKVNQITKTAAGTDYPDYSNPIAPDNTGMNSAALQLAANMYMGWNLGNTLEVPGSETGWGNPFKTLGKVSTWGQESQALSQFNKIKTTFVTQGYPVVLGEYGAIRRSALTGDALSHHLASRAYYLSYVTEQAKNYGMIPFYWDNGHTGNNGFALFNRNSATTFDRQALNAIQEGAAKGNYPF